MISTTTTTTTTRQRQNSHFLHAPPTTRQKSEEKEEALYHAKTTKSQKKCSSSSSSSRARKTRKRERERERDFDRRLYLLTRDVFSIETLFFLSTRGASALFISDESTHFNRQTEEKEIRELFWAERRSSLSLSTCSHQNTKRRERVS